MFLHKELKNIDAKEQKAGKGVSMKMLLSPDDMSTLFGTS